MKSLVVLFQFLHPCLDRRQRFSHLVHSVTRSDVLLSLTPRAGCHRPAAFANLSGSAAFLLEKRFDAACDLFSMSLQCKMPCVQ